MHTSGTKVKNKKHFEHTIACRLVENILRQCLESEVREETTHVLKQSGQAEMRQQQLRHGRVELDPGTGDRGGVPRLAPKTMAAWPVHRLPRIVLHRHGED